MESFQEIARKQNVELIVDDTSKVPVLADREAIHQVFSESHRERLEVWGLGTRRWSWAHGIQERAWNFS